MSKTSKNLPEGPQSGLKTTPKRRGCRRFLLLAAAALTVLLAAGLLAEAPKRRLVERAASRALGAEVTLRGVRLRPVFHVERLTIADPGSVTPLLEAHGVSLDYRLALPKAGVRLLPELRVDEAHIRLSEEAPNEANFTFLANLFQRPPAEDPFDALPFVPQRVAVERLSIEIRQPGAALLLGGLSARGSVRALDDFEASVKGAGIAGRLDSASPPISEAFAEGTVEAALARTGLGWEFRVERLALPGLIEGRANAALRPDGDGVRLSVEAPSLEAGPLPLGPVAHFLGVPSIAFSWLSVEGLKLDARLDDGSWTVHEASAALRATDLEIGEEDRRWHSGDLALHAALEERDGRQLRVTATFAPGQEASGLLEWGEEGLRIRAAAADWTREGVARAIPAHFGSPLEHLQGLKSLSVETGARFSDGNYQAEIEAVAHFDAGPMRIEGTGRTAAVPDGDSALFEGTFRLAMAGGVVSGRAVAGPAAPLRAEARVDDVNAAGWTSALTGQRETAIPPAVLSGNVEFRQTEGGAKGVLDLTARDLSFGALRLEGGEELAVSGTVDWDFEEQLLTADSLALAVRPAPAATLRLADVSLTLPDGAFAARASGEINVAWAGGKLNLPELWGEADVDLSFAAEGERVRIAYQASAPAFGYGNLTIPYGSTLDAAGTARYAPATGELSGSDMLVTIDEGTRAASGDWRFRTSTAFEGALPFSLTTDYLPLVAMGYLQDADGLIEARGELRVNADGTVIEADVDATARHLVLPAGFALLTDARFTGQVGYGPALFGKGDLAADQAVIAGAVIQDLRGPVALDGDRVSAKELAGVLFDGSLVADVEAGVLREGLPVTLSARGADLDLALFTDQVQPPRVTLSGRADAEATLELNADGLQDLNLRVRSRENLTVNRDIMRQVLLSQYAAGVTGARQLDRVVNTVLGPAPQRPFDSGAVDLDLEGGRLTGQAVLQSAALNLTIDLLVDPEALLAALQLSEQQVFQKIEGITPGRVDWGDE